MEELQRALGVVEGKLDGVVSSIATLSTTLAARELATDKRRDEAHDRINQVERKLYWMTGVGAALMFVATKLDFTKMFSIVTTVAKAGP